LLYEVDYKYDVFGNRVEADVDPEGDGDTDAITRYALDGWQSGRMPASNADWNVWAELDGQNSNALLTRYLRGDVVDQVFAREDGSGNAYWTLTDRLGSVRDLTDNTGVVKDTLAYDAYGNITSETASAYRGNYAWTGREFDGTTGLQYNRARFYDPKTGRWIEQDLLGFGAGDSNLYRYVKNGSTNATDPSGQYLLLQASADQIPTKTAYYAAIGVYTVPIPTGKDEWYLYVFPSAEAAKKNLDEGLRPYLFSPDKHGLLQPNGKVVEITLSKVQLDRINAGRATIQQGINEGKQYLEAVKAELKKKGKNWDDMFPAFSSGVGKAGERVEIIGAPNKPGVIGQNCFAFAAGDTKPFVTEGVTKPPNFKKLDDYYASKKFFPVLKGLSTDWTRGKQKIAIYGIVKDGRVVEITHAALQLPDGRWASRFGQGPIIIHNLTHLLGVMYGGIIRVYVKDNPLFVIPPPRLNQ
jgi:RHS repeat-associated protein